MAHTVQSATSNTLERRIGIVTAISVVVANVIGSGIFTTSGFIARDLMNPGALMLVWLVGGVLALAGALSYGELGAAMPEAGGEYVYLREAYSPLVGFLSGWMSFFIGFSGAIASTALLFSHYLGYFFPGVEPPQKAGVAIAIAMVWLLAAVHILGVGPGGLLQRLLTATKVVAIVLLIGAGLTLGAGSTAHFHSASPAVWSAFPVALVYVMFSYSGWNAAAYLAGEIRNPGRALPLSLLLGTILVMVLYAGLNAFYIYALPVDQLAGVPAVAEKASVAAFGPFATSLISAMVLLSLAACTSAMVLAGPRVYYAMARDGVFPSSIGAVHPRFRSPARAIVLQSIWCTVLIFFFPIEKLIVWTGFALVVFSALAVLAVFVLRVRRPDLPRPFRVPGYPVVPALFIAALVWIGVFTLRGRPTESLLGLLTVVLGVPFYFAAKARESRRLPLTLAALHLTVIAAVGYVWMAAAREYGLYQSEVLSLVGPDAGKAHALIGVVDFPVRWLARQLAEVGVGAGCCKALCSSCYGVLYWLALLVLGTVQWLVFGSAASAILVQLKLRHTDASSGPQLQK